MPKLQVSAIFVADQAQATALRTLITSNFQGQVTGTTLIPDPPSDQQITIFVVATDPTVALNEVKAALTTAGVPFHV